MAKEVCEVCTGSYTGEFSPKWRGPWAHYFSAAGAFLPLDYNSDERAKQVAARLARLTELRAKNRVPLGLVYS